MSDHAYQLIPKEFWSQDTGDVWDEAEPGDHFGFSLAKVNWMPNSSQDDLAIGVYGEDFPNAQDAGAVHILAGDLDGGLKEYPQDLKRQSWPEQAGARFGYAVARSGYRSIAVGAPLADVGSVVDAGSVTITGGLEQVWTQDSTDVLDQAEFGDRFGAPLIALGSGEPMASSWPSACPGRMWKRLPTPARLPSSTRTISSVLPTIRSGTKIVSGSPARAKRPIVSGCRWPEETSSHERAAAVSESSYSSPWKPARDMAPH